MEQLLIRNLPTGTKVALRQRAEKRGTSVEAEARRILTAGLRQSEVSLAGLLACPDAESIEFTPARLGIHGRTVTL